MMWPKDPSSVFNTGGAGYVLNRRALDTLVLDLPTCARCGGRPSSEQLAPTTR
jgi:hypothetical protein